MGTQGIAVLRSAGTTKPSKKLNGINLTVLYLCIKYSWLRLIITLTLLEMNCVSAELWQL